MSSLTKLVFLALLMVSGSHSQADSSGHVALEDLTLWTQKAPAASGQKNVIESLLQQIASPFFLDEEIELTPSFQSGTTHYTSKVPYEVKNITVLGSRKSKETTVKVSGMNSSGQPLRQTFQADEYNFENITADVAYGFDSLTIGKNVLTIDVVDEDSQFKRSYTLVLERTTPDRQTHGDPYPSHYFQEVIITGDVEGVESAIARGIDVNSLIEVDNHRITPLLAVVVATPDNDIEIARLLIDAGADINIRTNDRTNIPPSASKIPSGMSALMASASMNNLEMSKLLVEAGANVNFKTENNLNFANGMTALMHGAVNGNEAMTRMLIEAGADLEATLSAPVFKGKFESVPGASALILAITFKNRDTNKLNHHIATILIEAGANVNAKVADLRGRSSSITRFAGISALMFAISAQNKQLVELLLERGADVRYKVPGGSGLNPDTSGLTALKVARNVNAKEITKILKKARRKQKN